MEEVLIENKDFLTRVSEAIGTTPLTIKMKKLDSRAKVPTYAHYGDVGMDLTAIDVEYNEEKDMYIYHTGLSFESDFHYGQFLFPRSSNNKTEAYLCNSVGIGDSAIYRGEIMICYKNRDSIELIAKLQKHETILESLKTETIQEAILKGEEIYRKIKDDAKTLKYAPYNVGDKIAQMVFAAYPNVKLEIVDSLSDSDRGVDGFGSTGN